MSYEKIHNALLSLLLWTFGGTLYFFCEVIFKTLAGHPENISWTMLLLALVLCIPLERFGSELPWKMPLYIQAFVCAAVITLLEFIVGIFLNIILQLNVWDYSNLPGNILGQICPQFSFIWFLFSNAAIVIFDYMRYYLTGGDKPHYYFWYKK